VRIFALLAVALAAVGCSSAAPTTPSPTAAITASPDPRLLPIPGPFRTFTFKSELSYPVASYTKSSRFVLYDNGAFVLDYPGYPFNYRGVYTESNGQITFEWEGWSAAGPWGATGTLEADTLTVRFNIIMQLTDFDDAIYALLP